jgi:EmrB/QacA subfamily drug resistance transporter
MAEAVQNADAGGAPVAAAVGEPPSGRRREVLIVLPGLMLALILAMLDQMVVSTALPRIVGDLGGLAHLSWVVTAYVLAATITTPLYGKLGDLYGRKTWLMIAIVIFLIGSALSGMAHSMDQLIAFRALQGLGAGGLMTGVLAAIGDLVSPRERGQYVGIMMAVMMGAMITGPLVGGYITDSLSWRWIFYINMPIGGAALLYLAFRLHLPRHKVPHKVDYLGAAVLAVAVTAIVLLTTWGGTQYAWGSAVILTLITVAVAGTAAFLMIERRAAEPIIPLHVFRKRNFSLAISMGFLLGLAMFGAMTFLPLYQQTVQHASPTVSGLLLIPMMLGMTTTSLIAGQVTSRTGRYKALPIIGGGIMTVAMLLLTQLGPATSRLTSMAFYVVLGLGMGFLMQITTLIAQNSVDPRDMGVASSSRTFFQQIGGSIGVSIFGVLFTRSLHSALASRLPGAPLGGSGLNFRPQTVLSLPLQIRDAVFYAIAHGIDTVFIWAAPAAILVFGLAWLIKEEPLRGSAPAAPAAPASESGQKAEEVLALTD